MLKDAKGNIWTTDVTYATIKRVRNWLVTENYWDGTKTCERPMPLAIDLLYLPDLVRMSVNPSEEFEVIAAWLFPQWDGKMTRDQFDELLTPEFKVAALKALREEVDRFFTGSGGEMTLEEVARAEAELVEKWRLRVRDSLQSILMNAGKSTPESSESVETPTT
jgi:hypothetical protein